MKKKFEVLKLNNEPYDFLIIATSYDNPLHFVKEIGKEIKVQKANLIFDLTLINGVKKNRYIKCEYEADLNQLQQCAIVKNINENIKQISQSYFLANEDIVQKSVISKSLKFLLKSGMV